MSTPFVHCHVHTEYSLLDGESRIRTLLEQAKQLGMPALALTDHGVLHGAIEFYKEAKTQGVRPIIGIEAYVAPRLHTDRDPKLDAQAFHLVLLARTTEGYKNLLQLTTAAHVDGFYYKPRIDHDLLAKHATGLLGLSGCLKGEIPQALIRNDIASARRIAKAYSDILGPGNFYLELQNHGIPEQLSLTQKLIALSKDVSLPLVATNDVHYVRRDDADAQDALMCVQMNTRLDEAGASRMGTVPEFYLKTPDEMARLFPDTPEALANTLAIADQCSVEIDLGKTRLPHITVPAAETPDSYLRHLAEAGLRRLFGTPTPAYTNRLNYELDVITKTGYAAYFLIVQDFVDFARNQGILSNVRGSAGGSLVLYACGVTDTDPIEYRLPFDRFLNLQRVSMPDIDVDFMDTRRDEVIKYVVDKYGADHVAQIITFGRMGARAAIRDVGRVLGMPYGDVDRMAKLVPGPMIPLQDALATVPKLRRTAEATRHGERLLELAGKLEGVARHASTHAAGVIISRDPLAELVPLQKATKGDLLMTQYDMHGVEALGLLKMDFLGLGNLTVLDTAVKLVKQLRGITIDLAQVPLTDPRTYALLGAGHTMGIFQLEGRGMTRFLMDMRPDRIQDLMAMVALFRPGPIANIPSYIRRKHGEEEVTYPHPLLEPVLKETYGILVYQEDVMSVAQAVAGFKLAEADVLRYAVGKKIKDKLQAQHEKFVAGARAKGILASTIGTLWELLEPFARYGFNRAHAANYARLAYLTAWTKANYPVEYMTALLSHHADDLDKIGQVIAECQRLGITVLPPDITQSVASFTATPAGIRFGLAAVKNVGAGAVEAIVAARATHPFTTLADFCARVNTRLVTQRTLTSLIKAGAFDSLGTSRAHLLDLLDETLKKTQRAARRHIEAQASLFDLAPAAGVGEAPNEAASTGPEFSRRELLAMEREMLGLYISDHPVREWAATLAACTTVPLGEIADLHDQAEITVGGLITTIQKKLTRAGATMAFVTIEDLTGRIEVTVFPRTFAEAGALLQPDTIILVRGTVEAKEQGAAILCSELLPLPAGPLYAGAPESTPPVRPYALPRPGAAQPGPQLAGEPLLGGSRDPSVVPPIMSVLHVRVRTRAELVAVEEAALAYPGTRRLILHVVNGQEHLRSCQRRVTEASEIEQALVPIVGADNVWMAPDTLEVVAS